MDDTFPLVDSATLPDAEKKRLRNSHPLYGRMNGEVIWMAYEELGYDAEACATVMDAELDLRHRTVSLMATLEQSPDACCVLELPDAPLCFLHRLPGSDTACHRRRDTTVAAVAAPLRHRLPRPCPPAVAYGSRTGRMSPSGRGRPAPAPDALPMPDARKIARSKEIWAFPGKRLAFLAKLG